MRNLLIMLLLAVTALFMLSCEQDNDSHPDTDYNFLSFTDFNEWYQSHTWGVRITVLARSEELNLTYILPYIRCYMDGAVSDDDTFFLSVNGYEVPLLYHMGNIIVDNIGPDIYLDYATSFHVIFKINGVDKINKTVNIPSDITVNAPASLDFTQPVTYTWSSAKTPDYQSAYCFVGHNPSQVNYHSNYFYRMISKYDRAYTLPTADYLAYFHDEYGSVENPAYLELYTAAVYARNFEEQDNNVICAEIFGSANITR